MLNASSQMKLHWKLRLKPSTDAYFRLLSVSNFTFGSIIDIRHLKMINPIIHNESSVKNASKTRQECNFLRTFAINFHFWFHFQKSSSDILCALAIAMPNFTVINQQITKPCALLWKTPDKNNRSLNVDLTKTTRWGSCRGPDSRDLKHGELYRHAKFYCNQSTNNKALRTFVKNSRQKQ